MVTIWPCVGAGIALLCVGLARTICRKGLFTIPGPLVAKISNILKVIAVYRGQIPWWNKKMHDKYGPVVRIGPNHVSFASLSALNTIYGSRAAFAKSEFYEPTTPQYEGTPLHNLFSLRDIGYHASFKRTIAGLYTRVAVLELQPKIDSSIFEFMHEIQQRYDRGVSQFDMSEWLHFFAFDCLGELNVSQKFGFMHAGKDVQGLIAKADYILKMTGFYAQDSMLLRLQMLKESIWKTRKNNPLLKFAFKCIQERMEKPTESTDMLNKFLGIHNENPDRLTIREIAASIFINMMAGHDVLAITLRAIIYHLARTPRSMHELRKEISLLDGVSSANKPTPYEYIENLPYLNAVVHEALRIHPNTGQTPERIVPPQGAVIEGYGIPGGTIVGVNAWVVHYNRDIYGNDVHVFRPERWLENTEEKIAEMKRSLFSFGAGPRGCIGRNIAMLQINKFVFEFYKHFDAAWPDLHREWSVHGSWVTKQTNMNMIITPVCAVKGDEER